MRRITCGVERRRMRMEQSSKSSALQTIVVVIGFLLSWCEAISGLTADGWALIALKTTMEDSHGSLANWNESSSSPCHWIGVSCDAVGNVDKLNISHQNLAGNISGDIGSLRHLRSLSLNSNNFSGPLPEELSLLSNLTFLNITLNHFVASLPSGLANLTLLQVLDCYNNNLSGNLPVSIVSLRNLLHLHLGGNNFVGSIPPEYGNFSQSLQYLSLSGNLLTGPIPPQLGMLTGLSELYLGWWNDYDGGIPSELGMLTKLEILDVATCGLNRSIPSELANLTQLSILYLYDNNLSGVLPPELGSLSKLLVFDLSGNELRGRIPDSYGGLKSVNFLSFFGNHFSGQMPAGLGDLPNVEVFQLWNNNLTGEIPQRLGSNGLLQCVDISGNKLTGGLPPDLCLGSQLSILIVMDNDLSGPIPDGIANCISLVHVRMGNNFFNGSIPPGFFDLTNATMLQLNDNRFSGPLPSVMRVPVLAFLDVSRNQLGGTIPDAVSDLEAIMTFHLEGNQFTGNIPSVICNMPVVYDLDLSSNYLSGEIPLSLGNCSMLSKLDLSRNRLKGEIPNSLGNLSVLAMLNLSRNLLTGSIPEDIEYIQSLTQVDFSYNNLSGPVPVEGEAEFYPLAVYEGNPFLCGGVLHPCTDQSNSPTDGTLRTLKKSGPTFLAWLVGAVFSASTLILLMGLCCFFRRYRFCFMRMLSKEGKVRPWKFTPFQRLDFTASEIVACLYEENIIGKGGAGTVFKGQMPSGEMVAVKKLACGKGTSSHDHGFSAEIRTLGKIRHRYIVKLLGFCTNNEMNLLVYEFMPNGSLGEFLHGAKSGLLDWSTRYNIAVQAANGLCYLHHDCSPIIVHRDVKSNNILLDSELGARVADFGLAKLFQDIGTSESMSSIAGSYGYIAPEYAYTLKVNEKSDIYSFGVVLMELITGKRPIEPEYGDGADIVQWVRTKIQSKEGVVDILDPRIRTSMSAVPLQEVMQVLRVALLCSSDHPVERPTMRDVVQMLSDVRPGPRIVGGSTNSRDLQRSMSESLLTDNLLTF